MLRFGVEHFLQGDDFLQKDGVAKFRTLRLLGDNEADDSSSSSDDDENVTSLHIPQDLIFQASAFLIALQLAEARHEVVVKADWAMPRCHHALLSPSLNPPSISIL